MKALLVIALTGVLVGHTAAGVVSFCKKFFGYDPLTLKTMTATVSETNCGGDFYAQDFDKGKKGLQVLWSNAKVDKLYTFIFVESEGDMNWCVCNIGGSTLTGYGVIGAHDQEIWYKPPKNPEKAVAYEALIYLQTDRISVLNFGQNDRNFKNFVQNNTLVLTGPKAGIQFDIKPRPSS